MGPHDAGRAWLESLGAAGLERLRGKIIASLGSFTQLSLAERADVADEAIYDVLRSGRLDPSRQPVAYVKTAAWRLAAKKVSRSAAESPVEHRELELLDDARTQVDVEGLAEEDQDLLGRVMRGLDSLTSSEQRETTVRRAYGESAQAIAQDLGISAQQVSTQRHRGVNKVRASPEVQPFVRQAYLGTVRRPSRPQSGA
ncbi:sigma-70 family RNA polymerase sigma factor [Streptomyces sp. NPDC001941]|uniref:sigma-70 family RNA polymerase sigma factor n=1 Tax=Streptomyces sp. NPDC001941 TaxID=3154659 RepID=UPI00332457A8